MQKMIKLCCTVEAKCYIHPKQKPINVFMFVGGGKQISKTFFLPLVCIKRLTFDIEINDGFSK